MFLPSHLDGDGFYRLLFPARELRRQYGWECHPAPFVTRQAAGRLDVLYGVWEDGRLKVPVTEWLVRSEFDVLVMQQREEPFWPRVIGELRAQGKRVLVDSDDAWFGLPRWNPGSRKTGEAVRAMSAQLRACDGLSVATPALVGMYAPFQENVRVIRNRLDWRMWADVTPAYEQDWRRIRVGWMGDSRWRAGDLRVLQGVIGPWLERNPDVQFVAAGDPKVFDCLGVPETQRVSVAATDFYRLDLADITATFDIGLVPLDLREGRVLNDCKSHLKGMEYNAAGIPFVASPSESYRWFDDRGGFVWLAKTPRQWHERLDELVANEELRHMCGWGGREQVRDQHSLQGGGVDEWADWISSGTHSVPPVALMAA